jgi:hypothetical protein
VVEVEDTNTLACRCHMLPLNIKALFPCCCLAFLYVQLQLSSLDSFSHGPRSYTLWMKPDDPAGTSYQSHNRQPPIMPYSAHFMTLLSHAVYTCTGQMPALWNLFSA